MYKLGVLTVSTSGFYGQRDDTSGRTISDLLGPPTYHRVAYEVIPDDRKCIEERFKTWADDLDIDLIVSTGGTGLSPTDVTPEACLAVVEKQIPGLCEAMRAETLEKTPMAMISRSVAGIRGNTLIVTLPGSPKAVRECIEVINPVLPHSLELLRGKSNGHPGTN